MVDGPCEESEAFEKLPVKQESGLTGLEADGQMRELLGVDFIKLFTMVKRFEPERLSAHVTGWKRRQCPEAI